MTIEQRLANLERENRTWRGATLTLLFIVGGYVGCSQSEPEPEGATLDDIIAAAEADAGQDADQSTMTFEESQRLARAPISPAAVPEHIQVKSLEIMNDRGQVVASLKGESRGASFLLNVLDAEGNRVRGNEIFLGTANELSRPVCAISTRGRTTILTGSSLAIFRVPPSAADEEVALAPEFRAVSIIANESGGGMFSIFNPFGKAVVDIQSNKSNEGHISVSDVNGNMAAGLSADAWFPPKR